MTTRRTRTAMAGAMLVTTTLMATVSGGRDPRGAPASGQKQEAGLGGAGRPRGQAWGWFRERPPVRTWAGFRRMRAGEGLEFLIFLQCRVTGVRNHILLGRTV